MQNNSYLLDQDFLQQIAEYQERIIYSRILLLSVDESPLECVEGKISQGSINIDGLSSVRRTCSLTMIAENANIENFYWGLNTKFKLDVGIKNPRLDLYPDEILWFPQGVYVITGLNISQSTNNYTINISGKDKMCLLNGEVGGSLPATINFGTLRIVENGKTTFQDILIKDIIKEAVQNYGNELPQNIIINDLDEDGLQMVSYSGEETLYLLKEVNTNFYANMTLDDKLECRLKSGEQVLISNDQKIIGDNLTHDISENQATEFYLVGDETSTLYTVVRFNSKNQSAIGYQLTDLTYAGELIASPGEALTSVLDKIKKMLGFYEYFYDIEGRFIFQRKKDYSHIPWDPILQNTYVDNSTTPYIFNFSNSILITTFQNTPNLLNLRNDFCVWGKRKSSSGEEIPICMRYAICKKPVVYFTPYPEDREKNEIYVKENGYNIMKYDWREILYQMARDYRRHYHEDDFFAKVQQSNPTFKNGKSGYEPFYIEMISFWRDIYNPDSLNGNKRNQIEKIENPDLLNFWIDFLDTGLDQFSIEAVGDRPKVINDDKVNTICNKKVPNVIFKNFNDNSLEPQKNGYSYLQPSEILTPLFKKTWKRKSAQESIEELLYKYSYCTESIIINAIPVYHLQPNMMISISDKNSGINGLFTITKMTIPLSYNGTMSINAIKTPEKIL